MPTLDKQNNWKTAAIFLAGVFIILMLINIVQDISYYEFGDSHMKIPLKNIRDINSVLGEDTIKMVCNMREPKCTIINIP